MHQRRLLASWGLRLASGTKSHGIKQRHCRIISCVALYEWEPWPRQCSSAAAIPTWPCCCTACLWQAAIMQLRCQNSTMHAHIPQAEHPCQGRAHEVLHVTIQVPNHTAQDCMDVLDRPSTMYASFKVLVYTASTCSPVLATHLY